MMKDVEWDEAKNDLCQQQRGFTFRFALQAFADPDRLIEPDARSAYGELRFRLMGLIKGRLYAVIYTMRGRKTRIISARKANRREQNHYHAHQNRR